MNGTDTRIKPGPAVNIWTDRHGHEYVCNGANRWRNNDPVMAHHRVLAYAWGRLEHPYDRREVDHEREIPWLNIEENLVPRSKPDHSRKTRRKEYARKYR